jgi:methionine--tRNA ligase beta chain
LEELGDRIVPFGANVFIERSDFFDLDGPEGETSNRKLPDGYKRLSQNQMVRLKYAYVIQCDEVVRDPNTQEPLELKCSYYPSTRSGVTPKDMKRVSGIIQWVEASSARKCTVNQYDRLFKAEEPGRESGNFLDDLNPGSHIVLNNAIVEPSVAVEVNNMMLRIENSQHNDNTSGRIYHSELSYQFERNGYFALDVSSSPSNLVFNRVVTLKDTWGESLKEKETEVSVDQLHGSKKSDSDGGMIEDVRRVAFRASKIVDVQSHPEAENLIVCQVECGDHDDKARVIVASLAGKVARDDLVGRKVVCVTNIKPSKMRGVESNGVLLVASNGGKGSDEFVEPLYVPDDVPVGELFSFEGKVPSNPDPMMKSKGAIKAFERVKASLQTNNKGEVAFVEGGLIYRLTSSAGPITTKTLVNAAVQ